jgi:hypothetical protein
MFDELVSEARVISEWLGDPGILPGIQFIGQHLEQYDETIQRQYRGFMRMGQDLFAPKEKEDFEHYGA